MHVFAELEKREHEQVVYCSDKATGLRAIVAIHNTTLGPALGGCRMWPYQSEEDALRDVLRLSRGMTYKSALAGLHLGGGKAVIMGDSKTMKSPELFRAFGRFVQSLGGRYITAEDVGTSVQDMETVHQTTDFVTGISQSLGGSGDPSPVTALGVFEGIKAAFKWQRDSESLEGIRVAVQGVGHVGYHLVQHLVKAGAKVTITDIDQESVKRVLNEFPTAEYVEPQAIYDVECDVFAPCALGGVINDQTLPRLRCGMVAGSANNVLGEEEKHIELLGEREILYIPDYVINAGGIINVANELNGYDRVRALKQAEGIFDAVYQILQVAQTEHVSTLKAANTLAERRLAQAAPIRQMYVGVPLRKARMGG